MSDAATSYDFEPLEASDPPPRDAMARILAQALADGERIRESARAEGYEQGRAAGHEHGMAEIANAAGALGEAVQAVQALRVETVQTVERDSIELAIALAEQDPRGRAAGASGAGRGGRSGRAAAHQRQAHDHRARQPRRPRGRQGRGRAADRPGQRCRGVRRAGRRRVEPGSAIVRTGEGEVDAGVYTQLERASEVAAAALEADGQAA